VALELAPRLRVISINALVGWELAKYTAGLVKEEAR
jgi:hypothetical protein